MQVLWRPVLLCVRVSSHFSRLQMTGTPLTPTSLSYARYTCTNFRLQQQQIGRRECQCVVVVTDGGCDAVRTGTASLSVAAGRPVIVWTPVIEMLMSIPSSAD